ncbi:MAG: radical SAM protein [Deltaproteobacteria bacterium]|nr:MAG: radical SAM protein [Deltaproteobacteria bacterium]
MQRPNLEQLPFMLFADAQGRIYEHPYLRMAGASGARIVSVNPSDLIPLPEYSKLFYMPECSPIGLDPKTERFVVVDEVELGGEKIRPWAVSAFLEPGYVRTHLPAADYSRRSYYLPMWAYTAVGFADERYWAAALQIEYSHRWDPRNYDDKELIPAIELFQSKVYDSPLVRHLIKCATDHHCFAAKNLFLRRWEAPLPVSRSCNAACLGCLSAQPDGLFEASHDRLAFRPSKEEVVKIAVSHLEVAEDAIVSFGQGCEGEPLTESALIAESIIGMRRQTQRGTINLNTNGSIPQEVRRIAHSGLDSIRISLNSARHDFYRAYYRPKGYGYEDVVESIKVATGIGLYTMVNLLIFPGISDQEEELESLIRLIEETGLNFLHLKNLNIDPAYYIDAMPDSSSVAVGIKEMIEVLKSEFPNLRLGYFNQPIRKGPRR